MIAKIRSYLFNSETLNDLSKYKYANDWPLVYILENGKEIYIGETMNAIQRLKSHSKNPVKKQLNKVHLITDDMLNKSATLDIESWLIQFINADQKYVVQNANAGMADHNYYNRELYKAKFETIWAQLQRLGLAEKDLIQLKNTDIFKYSPYKELNSEQLEIVHQIQSMLATNIPSTNIINGDPGTGKTIVAVYLAKYLMDKKETKNLKIALVVSMTGFRNTLKKVFSKVKGLSPNMVIGPNEVVGNYYDLIIVDEAHRLRRRVNLTSYSTYDKANEYYNLGKKGTQLDWILNASKSQVLLYDKNQTITPGDIRPEMFNSLNAIHYKLTSQLRSLGGNDYIDFIDKLLSCEKISKVKFNNYDLKYFNSAKDLVSAIKAMDSEIGLCRTVAGYAWNWITKKDNTKYDIELEDIKLKWNSKAIDWVNSPNAINEIGCIHTIQGYDLNYVGVILGPEISYNAKTKMIEIDKDKYKDFNGKRTIVDGEELKKYIVNIYKTLLTRGIKGTYIHAVDKNMADYIKRNINT